ncbi:MAG: hypothetical protein EXR76_16730 [Myxococcales bacterium]|nr:hypothetical protein [Myxococcales bacterium]
MMKSMKIPVRAASLAFALLSCSGEGADTPRPADGPSVDASRAGDVPGADVLTDVAVVVDVAAVVDIATIVDAAVMPPDGPTPAQAHCTALGLPQRAFADGPYGEHRHDLADDFTLPLMSGEDWNLRASFTGCDVYVFIPDTQPISQLDSASIWTRDLDLLVERSPRNAHYFFVSRRNSPAGAAALNPMKRRIADMLDGLDAEKRDYWQSRLHLVSDDASELNSYVGRVTASGIGLAGFMIDREQRLRGIGSLSDVTRSSQRLQDAGGWPWEANLAYVTHDVRYANALALRHDERQALPTTVVELFRGEVVSEFAEVEVELPAALVMDTFDTFEIEIDMRCPNPDAPEFNNCGAWDYLAYLYVYDEAGMAVQLGRFITSYHRETHWIADVTPMMWHLRAGGMRRFKWLWAPPWNVQPTETRLKLHFSNRGRGMRPAEPVFLYGGGGFGSMYNVGRVPTVVDIPADAKKVELWAIITGHGADQGQCAEFCDHQHAFTIEGHEHRRTHTTVGQAEGCVSELERGMVPNQWGTWWFGRGGWCPGQQVDPWVVDVTDEVTPGMPATVEYRGLFGGADPTDGHGNIDMISYLTVYR